MIAIALLRENAPCSQLLMQISISDPKEASFLKINPNGRLPALKDPNANDLIIWESGAIVEYLVETYDKEHKLTFVSGPEKWYLKQYLHFQMSGQVRCFSLSSSAPPKKKGHAILTIYSCNVGPVLRSAHMVPQIPPGTAAQRKEAVRRASAASLRRVEHHSGGQRISRW